MAGWVVMAASTWMVAKAWLSAPVLVECAGWRGVTLCTGGVLGLAAMAGWVVYWLLECWVGVVWVVRKMGAARL